MDDCRESMRSVESDGLSTRGPRPYESSTFESNFGYATFAESVVRRERNRCNSSTVKILFISRVLKKVSASRSKESSIENTDSCESWEDERWCLTKSRYSR